MSDAAGAALAETLRHLSGRAFGSGHPRKLGVAVSGGGDSMALLDLMAWHAARLEVPVEAVTVDHGLRPEAADEAAFVAAHCAGRSIPHRTLTWDRAGGGNLPARARAARYRLIADWAAARGIDCVALGHTRDDQAENLLIRLSRSAGVDGLAAMEARFERHGVTWIRPLLSCAREDLRTYLDAREIRWCEDPSNEDPAYDRSRAREILRALAPLGLDTGTLARVSENLSDAKHALQHYTRAEAARLARQDGGDVVLTRAPVPPVPAEIERRLLVAAIQWVSGAPYPPRQSALAELEAALSRTDTFTMAGCVLTLSRPDGARNRSLRVTREWSAVKHLACPTDALWDGRWRLSGPHAPGLEIRALGEAVAQCPGWRESGLPRQSLLASPAIWRGETLVAAPLAGVCGDWTADLAETRCDFVASLLLR